MKSTIVAVPEVRVASVLHFDDLTSTVHPVCGIDVMRQVTGVVCWILGEQGSHKLVSAAALPASLF